MSEKAPPNSINPNDLSIKIQESKESPEDCLEVLPQKNQNLSYIKQQQKTQNPKIGRPAKTDQEEQFKKCYMQNKQKFQLQCELLVFIHQSYFDEIIQNPINTRVSKLCMDRLFIVNNCEDMYRTLLKLNEVYFKNSSIYPHQKLKYTSIIDIAYMFNAVKQKHGQKMSSTQLLLIIFFFLFNEKLVNESFYKYFVENFQKLREGMIFGPGGKNGSKLQKLDKLIICLALTLADLQKIVIEQQVTFSDEECSKSESQNQDQQDMTGSNPAKRNYNQGKIHDISKPTKKFHEDY